MIKRQRCRWERVYVLRHEAIADRMRSRKPSELELENIRHAWSFTWPKLGRTIDLLWSRKKICLKSLGKGVSSIALEQSNVYREAEVPQNRVLSQEEREAVLARVRPQGAFKPAKQRTPFGVQPVPWEEKLGNLDEWRENRGKGRAILPALATASKSQSVCNSIMSRLRKLFVSESWTAYVGDDGKNILLRFNGPKRTYERQNGENGNTHDSDGGHGLFAETG